MNLAQLMKRFNVQPKGIIHYGGVGAEVEEYVRLGFKLILIVQPDPVLFSQVQQAVKGKTHVLGVNCDLDEKNGYRQIGGSMVPVRRLDTLIVELRRKPKEFNAIMAAKGDGWEDIGTTAEHVRMFANATPDDSFGGGWHYKGVLQLNLWQKPHGRFANEIFQHFFASQLCRAHGMQLHTMPWAGNSLFGISDPLLETELPTIEEHYPKPEKSRLWMSMQKEIMFPKLNQEEMENLKKAVDKSADEPVTCMAASVMDSPTSIANTHIFGNFQFHTGLYSVLDRHRFRDTYRAVPDLEEALRASLTKMMGGNKTLVAVHLRRADYVDNHPGMFYRTPVESYLKWLGEIWPLLDKPLLYVASDDPFIAQEFKGLIPYTSRDMKVPIAEQFYVDFWVLTQAHALAISNSSYSFAAAMLNENEPLYVPPHLSEDQKRAAMDLHARGGTPEFICHARFVRPLRDGTMRPFDPWNDDVLLGRYDMPEFGSSEEECLKILADLLPKLDPKREGAFIEVGLGTFAWFFEIFSRMGFQCHAVEPMPVEGLKKSCMLHHTSLTEAVMGEIDGRGMLSMGRTPDLNSLDAEWWGKGTDARVEVAAVSLNTMTTRANIEQVTCLKIDVEGAEGQIIEQLTSRVNNLPAVVMFEYGGTPQKERAGGWGREAVHNTLKCLEHLASRGYSKVIVVEGGHRPTEMSNAEARTQLADFLGEQNEKVFKGADYGNIIAIRDAQPA